MRWVLTIPIDLRILTISYNQLPTVTVGADRYVERRMSGLYIIREQWKIAPTRIIVKANIAGCQQDFKEGDSDYFNT
jgi:hypothetical protein